jgi:hypothetical protein
MYTCIANMYIYLYRAMSHSMYRCIAIYVYMYRPVLRARSVHMNNIHRGTQWEGKNTEPETTPTLVFLHSLVFLLVLPCTFTCIPLYSFSYSLVFSCIPSVFPDHRQGNIRIQGNSKQVRIQGNTRDYKGMQARIQGPGNTRTQARI